MSVRVGRFLRGSLASLTLTFVGFFSFVALTFSCCGSGSLAASVQSPLFWGSCCAGLVCLAAIPKVSTWLRGRQVRWALLPLALGSLAYTWVVVMGPFSVDWEVTLPLLSAGLCALYVLVRVLPGNRPTRDRRASTR